MIYLLRKNVNNKLTCPHKQSRVTTTYFNTTELPLSDVDCINNLSHGAAYIEIPVFEFYLT